MKHTLGVAITMITYGLAVLFIGALTYFVAPPGSNALTALVISVATFIFMTACAVLSLQIDSNRRLGMIGIHVGLILPLLIALGPAMRLRGSLNKAHEFNEAVKQTDGATVTVESMKDKAKPHPVAYQSVGLGGIAAVSVFAFVALLVQRPRVPKALTPHQTPPDLNEERPRDNAAGS